MASSAAHRPPRDELPRGILFEGADRAHARLLGELDRTKFYAFPKTLRGKESLCVYAVRSAGAGGGCSSRLRLGSGVESGDTYALLLPDGTRDLRVHLRSDGRRTAPADPRQRGVRQRRGAVRGRLVDGRLRAPPDQPERVRPPRQPFREPLPGEPRPAAAGRAPPGGTSRADRGRRALPERRLGAGRRRRPRAGHAVRAGGDRSARCWSRSRSPRRDARRRADGRLLVGMRDGALRVFYLLR